MKKISLNNFLNKDNVWTHRLLNNNFKVNRDLEHIQKEYNEDKYKCLIHKSSKSTAELKAYQWKLSNDTDNTHISFKDEIFSCSIFRAQNFVDNNILETVKSFESENICELGTGYGYNLSLFEKSFNLYGGELTKNGVEIAKSFNLDVNLFNFYNKEDYKIIRPNTTLFTHHALEQIPNSNCFIEYLSKFKKHLNFIVNIEPSIIPTRKNLLGILRNKYIEINDYNRNIHQLIKNNDEIEVLLHDNDVIGNGPLNSSCLTVWRFKN